MPDFLHTDSAQESPKKNSSPASSAAGELGGAVPPLASSSSAPAPASPPRSFRHRADSSPSDEVPPPASVIKRAPLRVWTDYYGAVFLLMVAVFIGIGSFVLRPLVIKYRQLAGTISASATLIGDEHGYLQSVQGSISAAQSIPPETLANVDEALPREANIPKLLEAMALFAKKENATMNSVQFTAPEADPSATNGEPLPIDINISVSLSGYAGFREFLSGVEHSLRLLDMGSISVTSADIGGNTGSSDHTPYTFQLRTYFLPPPPPVSS